MRQNGDRYKSPFLTFMTKVEGSGLRSLPKELRDRTRRGEILDAASRCVVRRGFHATSMVEIAAGAAMSVGQIYRYFASKEAIVHALVERIVDNRLALIETHDRLRTHLAAELAQRLTATEEPQHREEKVLMIEITAEATRNPEVARVLRRADERLRDTGAELMRHAFPELSRSQLLARLELIAALAEGTAQRRINGITREQERLSEVYNRAFEAVFPPDEPA